MATIQTPPSMILHEQIVKTTSTASLTHQKHSNSKRRARTIAELIDIRADEDPDGPIISYPSTGIEYVDYTYNALQSFTKSAAALLAKDLLVRENSSEGERVVAILGLSDLDYLINAVALSRLGFTVLFLSTRISDAAYISLLNATKCTNIVYYPKFAKVVESLRSMISGLSAYERLTKQQYSQPTSYLGPALNLEAENQRISWIIHSSGSTGMPKPIYQTHDAALKNYENNMNMRGFITLPLFHAHGLSSVFRAITSRKQIFMYNAELPLAKSHLLSIFRRHRFEIFYGVPYALKLLSEDEEGISMLANMRAVMFGGSACPDALGDKLVESGVNLISHYGTTETGQLMTSFRPAGDKAWNYVRVHDALRPYVRWEPCGGNLFELVVLDGWKSKVATNRDDGSYRTKDLFEPHPQIPEAWKFGGRLDDTIVLVNGEKTIPLATEQAIRQNENVKDNVIFGNGRPQLGMIIIASEMAKDLTKSELIQRIWPVLERCNSESSAYAHIVEGMIQVLPHDTDFPQTDKGTLIRQAFYKKFAHEIDSIYEAAENNSSGTLRFSEEDMRSYVKEKICDVLMIRESATLTDTTDFFSLGLDSLQAIRLRMTFLKDLDLGGGILGQNVVFEYPSIGQLARKLYCTRTGEEIVVDSVENQMKELIQQYSQFPSHVSVEKSNDGRHVVVTGATGSLGAHLVSQLVKDATVKTVYTLVRSKSAEEAQTRVLKSLLDRGLLHEFDVQQLRKISAFPFNIDQDDLGLGAVYTTLCDRVTDLIHCAWSVNFNKGLRSFEYDCIAGTRNLLLLCLRAKRPKPASFNFCSSVSTVVRTPGGFVPEALPESLSYAQDIGYAQSKLVTEHIVCQAAESTGMKARILRIGQISADTQHGIWNETEAIPIMIEAAVTIGALPKLNESLRWLPVDAVAEAVYKISLSEDEQAVYNIVNPQTFHWTNQLLPAIRDSGLQFDELTQREWIARLRSSNPDPTLNPPIKLLDFFASKYDNDITIRPTLDYGTTKAEAVAPILSNVGTMTTEQIQKFIHHTCNTSWAPLIASKGIKLPWLRLSTPEKYVIVVAGPCGVGKSTIGSLLSTKLQCPLIEGDSHHDEMSITKMSNSVNLAPIDRAIWLARLKVAALQVIKDQGQKAVVITCSALRAAYRDLLRDLAGDGTIQTRFILLLEEETVLIKRLEKREGHFMGADMVKGQLDLFERPGPQETDVLPFDAGLAPESIVGDALGFNLMG